MATAASKKKTASQAPKEEIYLLPLNKLVTSPLNVRKTGGQSIEDLAASIQAETLLQNLTVIEQVDAKGKATGRYEVTAGARRLKALQLLTKRKAIPADYDVPCKIVTVDRAVSASLAENQMREAMHPADQFEAFKRMIDGGRTIEETAAAFSVSEKVVRQRLKLASVHPDLIELYRQDKLRLEAVIAYAATEDQALQLQVFNELPDWRRSSPSYIEEMLRAEEVSSNDPLVKFVGLDAYRAAGGAVTEDLFSEHEGEFYLADSALLNRLATEKLGKAASKVKKEGWGWVEVKPVFGYQEKQDYTELPRVQLRELTDEERARLQQLQADLNTARKAFEEIENEDAPEDDDEDDYDARWQAANDQVDALEQKLHEMKDSALGIAPEQMAIGGAVITIDGARTKVIRGLVKKEDRKAAQAAAEAAQRAAGVTPVITEATGDDDDTGEATASGEAKGEDSQLSQAMRLRLYAQRSIALQATLATQPAAALAAVTAVLVHEVLGERGYYERPVGLQVNSPKLHLHDKDIGDSKAAQALTDLRCGVFNALPDGALGDPRQLIEWLMEAGPERCTQILAVCAAHYVTAGDRQPLLGILNLDMRQWWTADQPSFLSLVPKPVIVEAVTEACGAEAAKELSPLKKAAAAKRGEELLAGTGWLPAPLRSASKEESGK